MHRTHTCGELTKKEIGGKVVLDGWVHARRDHGGLTFIDLRDRYGFTQVVFDPKTSKQAHELAYGLRREDVIEIEGVVRQRPKGTENPNMITGDVEVAVSKLEILNKSETPPLEVDDRIVANDDMRLKFRYLDLRRPIMQKHLLIRHKAMQATRGYLNSKGFLEIETPFLVRNTPEGARDFLVPSRIHPGKTYSLPQSPQLYKQLLMVSGCDRYYQIARCLRDEDLRVDRQLEFSQIDLEMSFINEFDIYELVDSMIKHIFKKVIDVDLKIPFQRIPYKEAMDKYGCDKPDLRFGMELFDATDILKKSDFEIFKKAEMIKGLCAKKCAFTRKELDHFINLVKPFGAKGLVSIKIEKGEMESSVTKYMNAGIQSELKKKSGASDGDVIFLVADKPAVVNASLAALRNHFGKELKLYNEKDFKFCWIVDYPMFGWSEEEEKWEPMHHIFTMPKPDHIPLLDKDPSKVLGQLYDLVLNGTEIASGSIRIHRPDIQEKVLNIIGISKKEANEKFGFLMEAFKYGAPPHGGIAPGFDRLVALMCGFNDIREVIAFPKTKAGECPMDGCPSEPDPNLLKELHIKFDVGKK